MAHLTCTGLKLAYEGKTVLEGLTFSVCKGDYLCIVGENGSGKSTLLQAVLKLKAPSAGSVELGEELSRREIGYLPQRPEAQRDFPASVREVVRSGCLARTGYRPFLCRAEKTLAEKNMSNLGILGLAARCFSELSGGQQQRVLLARAMCAGQKLLVLDEPAAALDPSAATEMYALIKARCDMGVTVIMVTHDITASLKYATKILNLRGHSAFFFGTKSEFLQSDHGRAYAGLDSDPL